MSVCFYSVFVLPCVLSCDGLIARPMCPTVFVKNISKLNKKPGPNKGL
jgi:hypothetical protein